MDKNRKKLINIIAESRGWGPASTWQGGDFRRLSQMIFDKTHVNISESTLRRLFGKADYPHLPSETTLNTLAVFAGYESWRDFTSQTGNNAKGWHFGFRTALIGAAAIIFLLLATITFYHYEENTGVPNVDYVFTSRPVTRAIPNSVIFSYNAGKQVAPVYIQQSWDDHTRVRVATDGNIYASVYYRPGFYQAKLLVGNKVVREHPLLIPTNGWLGLIYRNPVPVYLKQKEFFRKDMLEVPPAVFADHSLKIEPDLPRAELYNVGNFTPVPANRAGFSAMIKSDYNAATGVCGKMMVFLITNGVPISIPVCSKGCVATIACFNGRGLVSGKTADLSGFGVTPGSWVNTEVKTLTGKLQLLVNNHLAYEGMLPPAGLKIVGVAFGFEGGGAVKSVLLKSRNNVVFTAY